MDGVVQGGVQGFAVRRGEGGEDPVGQVVVGMGLLAHADLHPGELVRAGEINDVLHAVVAAVAALAADPQPPGIQVDVVEEDQGALRGQVIKRHGLLDGLAAEVHERGGLE